MQSVAQFAPLGQIGGVADFAVLAVEGRKAVLVRTQRISICGNLLQPLADQKLLRWCAHCVAVDAA